jgi:hypothetical protein
LDGHAEEKMAFEQEEERKREQVRAGVQGLNSRVMPELLKAKEAFRKNRVELVIHQHYDVERAVEARPHIAAWCQEVHTGSSVGRATNMFSSTPMGRPTGRALEICYC